MVSRSRFTWHLLRSRFAVVVVIAMQAKLSNIENRIDQEKKNYEAELAEQRMQTKELENDIKALRLSDKTMVEKLNKQIDLLAGTGSPGIENNTEQDVASIPGIIMKSVFLVAAADGSNQIISLGTCFAVGKNGTLCTNNHVVENASYVYVIFEGEYIFTTVKYKNKLSDIALLTVLFSTRPLETKTPLDKEIGRSVFAIGFPWISVTGEKPTVTHGILSGISKDGKYLITDAAINRGNSGGPLIDAGGRVIGMNTFIVRDNQIEGGGFAMWL